MQPYVNDQHTSSSSSRHAIGLSIFGMFYRHTSYREDYPWLPLPMSAPCRPSRESSSEKHNVDQTGYVHRRSCPARRCTPSPLWMAVRPWRELLDSALGRGRVCSSAAASLRCGHIWLLPRQRAATCVASAVAMCAARQASATLILSLPRRAHRSQ